MYSTSNQIRISDKSQSILDLKIYSIEHLSLYNVAIWFQVMILHDWLIDLSY